MSNGKDNNPDETSQIRFLSDKPLDADYEQNDRFGHSSIAENLKHIISICPLPFTIGLFGKWGSGKTSILNILKDKVAVEHRIPFVIFDVWKHEGDALRRTFLKEIVKQLKEQGLLEKYELSERVSKSISIKKTVEKIDCLTFSIAIILILIMIGFGIYFYNTNLDIFKTYLAVVTGGSLVTGLLLWLFQRMIITEDITKKANRFEDPHEFEQEFYKILAETKPAKRLLISIDNLDRCIHSKAVELLSTIRTFLAKDSDTEQNNKCIFLIPCDDKAIKIHLRKVYSDMKHSEVDDTSQKDDIESGSTHNSTRPDNDIITQRNIDLENEFDADEFLRKFFHTFLCLPDFIDTELEGYTEDLLKQTNIEQFDNANVAHVITVAFRDNPRQIKQFINILTAHFLMAKNRESGSNPLIVPEGTITNNIDFLAKLLVIRQNFPSEYKNITEKYLPIEEWTKVGKQEFKSFLNSTKTISVNNIEPFVHLKQSREELKIPNYREIRLGLLDNKPETIKEKLGSFETEPSKIGHLRRLLSRLIERNAQRRPVLFNIISCFLEAFDHSNLNLPQYLYERIGAIVGDDHNGLKQYLPQFNPKVIFMELLHRCKKSDRSAIIEGYISCFSKTTSDKGTPVSKDAYGNVIDSTITKDYAYELLNEFVNHKKWLGNNQRMKIRKVIEDTYYQDVELLSLFEKDVKNQNDFISEQTLSKFISTFSQDDVEDKKIIGEKIRLLLKFRVIIEFKTTESILVRLQELLDAENKLPLDEVEEEGEISRKENLLGLIEDILSTLSDKLKDGQLQTQLNSLADRFGEGINALPNWSEHRIFILSSFLVIPILDDPHKSKIGQLIQNFFTNADLDSIQFVFNNDKLRKNNKTQLISQYLKVFTTRVIADQSIFDYLYPIASKEIRPEWLVELTNSQPKRAVEKLESLGYKTDDNKKVVQALLQKVTAVAIQEKTPIYKTINEMKCANNAALKNLLGSQIQELLKTIDAKNQEVGYETLDRASSYLSEATRRNVAAEVIDWLRSPAVLSNPYQPNSVKSVILSWDILEPTPKNDYIYFIFHNLIMSKVNIVTIELGFGVLLKINVLYDENTKTNFDDTLSCAENETKQDIKAAIIDGLILLKLPELKQKDKAFWTKVQKLQE